MGVQPGFTRNNKQKFDVTMSDGAVFTCFRPEQATKAQNALNQPGVTIMVSYKDQYKNFEDVLPAGVAPPQGFQQQQFNPQAQAQGGFQQQAFTPPPAGLQDPAKVEETRRIVRGNAVNAAASALGNLIGTGIWVDEKTGELDSEAVAGAVIDVARELARYVALGPVAAAAPEGAEEAPPLPQGVTPQQAAEWAQAQGAAVTVGAPVPAPEAPPEAPKTAY